MATIDCNACADLIADAPEFMARGVTDTVCESLNNNTGLNPHLSVLHENCEDFEKMNDCLIGKKAVELKAYSDCDWKKFAKDFIQNLYQYLKALNCSICGLWARVVCVYNGIVKLIEALDGSVGGSSFVRYFRDNSGTGAGYEWPAVLHESHTLDIYMDADVDNPGTKPADRDYVVIVSNCFNFHHASQFEATETIYSSGDTRSIDIIRKRQGMHPMVTIGTVVNDWSWNLTNAVIIREGEHVKLNTYVESFTGASADYRVHQVSLTWIPIAPVGGWDLSDILDC